MPEIHEGIKSLLSTTIIVIGVVALFLQAVRFLLAAIMQTGDE
jgi:multidrug efflux pump subunit AcrB